MCRGSRSARVVAPLVAALLLIAAPAAPASIGAVFTGSATPIPCAAQSNGVRLCDEAAFAPAQQRSTVAAFDGVPLDVRVAFPPAPASGPDGPYPLLMLFHRYGGAKEPLPDMQPWLNKGYATLSVTDRGFGESCGTEAARGASPAACARGYVRLMDTRYEVRDAQELAGLLADDGVIDPQRIGATGRSYGGAISLALAALNDRKMLPDGTLVDWRSPSGKPLRIAAAVPETAWSDLVASLVPNGSTLDYVRDASYTGPTGVLKSTWENALYAIGAPYFYAPAGADPLADLTGWHKLLNDGEPYDGSSGPLPAVAAMRNELTTYHSASYLDGSRAPAPVLMVNGFTDDLTPADEAIRFFNRTRSDHPGTPIALFLASLGHPRGQQKAGDILQMGSREVAWLNYYVKGVGSPPFQGVQAFTQTCPNAAPSGGPYFAPSWAAFGRGEIRVEEPGQDRIAATAGSASIATTFDPLQGGGACATAPADDQPGVVTLRAPAAAGPFTMIGSPTVSARYSSRATRPQVAARLLDVEPAAGTETLVARGLWRIDGAAPADLVFQMHPNAYTFAAGHLAKLELLPNDAPYGRASTGQEDVRVSNLQLRLPVVEPPGALGGLVQGPAPKVLPGGRTAARDFRATPYPHPLEASFVQGALVPAFRRCSAPSSAHGAPLAFGSCAPPVQTSSDLTVGAASSGIVDLDVVGDDLLTAADEADVTLGASLTDVRRRSDLAAYAGELDARLTLRITDRGSGAGQDATIQDTSVRAPVPCVAVVDPALGSTCSLSTTLNALVPGVAEDGARAIWEAGDLQVFDGGADGVARSGRDNRLLARQGLFVP